MLSWYRGRAPSRFAVEAGALGEAVQRQPLQVGAAGGLGDAHSLGAHAEYKIDVVVPEFHPRQARQRVDRQLRVAKSAADDPGTARRRPWRLPFRRNGIGERREMPVLGLAISGRRRDGRARPWSAGPLF